MFRSLKSMMTLVLLVPISVAMALATSAMATGGSDKELAEELALLLRSARKVISTNQSQINRQDIADKGLGPDAVVEMTRQNHLSQTHTDINDLDATTREGILMLGLIAAVRSVMTEAQPLINDTDVGFKGFLPAVFAREVSSEFNKAMGERAQKAHGAERTGPQSCESTRRLGAQCDRDSSQSFQSCSRRELFRSCQSQGKTGLSADRTRVLQ